MNKENPDILELSNIAEDRRLLRLIFKKNHLETCSVIRQSAKQDANGTSEERNLDVINC